MCLVCLLFPEPPNNFVNHWSGKRLLLKMWTGFAVNVQTRTHAHTNVLTSSYMTIHTNMYMYIKYVHTLIDLYWWSQQKLDRRIRGRGVSLDLTESHLVAWSYFFLLVLIWIHLVSRGLACPNLGSLDLTWCVSWLKLISLAIIWVHLMSLGFE